MLNCICFFNNPSNRWSCGCKCSMSLCSVVEDVFIKCSIIAMGRYAVGGEDINILICNG